jgi:mannose-1-phosphate guanylyltransferase/mannose-6-phosphate isomerase
MILPVILSGGSGTRLWPLSRRLYPKQFLSLVNKVTLFQDTVLRLPSNLENPIVICNEEHRFIAAEQLRQINKQSNCIILEPEGKNTAPAIALSAFHELKNDHDPILLVLSADHVIHDIKAFHRSIEIGSLIAQKDKLVTFGAKADKPDTGYGYIEFDNTKSKDYFDIKSFIEKPNEKAAKKYLQLGNFLWNTGMFMFKASIFLKELKKFEPDIFDCCFKSIQQESKDNDFVRINHKQFSKCLNKSIDFAVMEKTKEGVVVPLSSNWSDVGSWTRLFEEKKKDSNGNFCDGDILINDVKNSFIKSTNRLVSVLGVSDLIIIETKDSILISDKNQSEKISKIIDKLIEDKRTEQNIHTKVYRPWGFFDTIEFGKDFQVKKLQVNPGSKLSLQKHHHRSEHWVVTSGEALVTCGKKIFKLMKNESTFIPKGETHRLENQGKKLLEIIEIQTGSYLGEDDITRMEDDYKRN